jgi:hypothetical protein
MLITSLLINKFIKLTAIWFNVVCILATCFHVIVTVTLLFLFSSGISSKVLHLFLIHMRCKLRLITGMAFRRAE